MKYVGGSLKGTVLLRSIEVLWAKVNIDKVDGAKYHVDNSETNFQQKMEYSKISKQFFGASSLKMEPSFKKYSILIFENFGPFLESLITNLIT